MGFDNLFNSTLMVAQTAIFLLGIRHIIRIAYVCLKKREPIVIAAISLKHLPEAEEDIQALRVTYSNDKIVEMYQLDTKLLAEKLQAYAHRKIYLHIGCHCYPDGELQFDNEKVNAYKLVSTFPRGGIDTVTLMCCFGGKVAPYILGSNAAKNVLYTEFDNEIGNQAASAITRVFWQEMKKNYGKVRTSYIATHNRLPVVITNNLRLSTFRSRSGLFN